MAREATELAMGIAVGLVHGPNEFPSGVIAAGLYTADL
jgi:hypothetical protein